MKTLLSTVAVAALLSAAQPANAFVSLNLVRHTYHTVKTEISNLLNRPADGPGRSENFSRREGALNEDGLTDWQATNIHNQLVAEDQALKAVKSRYNNEELADWEWEQALEQYDARIKEIGRRFRNYRHQNLINADKYDSSGTYTNQTNGAPCANSSTNC